MSLLPFTDESHRPRLQFRRGSLAAWQAKNPVLASGEPVYETDTQKYKIGDGVTPYNDLPYEGLGDEAAVSHQELSDHINSEDPHPSYDDGRSLILLYENAKV